MEVTILRDPDAVQQWKATWQGLPLANPFSRWEFARGWLEQSSVEPFIIVVKDSDGHVLAIAPWSLRKKAGGIRLLEGVWGYDGWHHDPWVADPSREREVSDRIVEALRQSRKDWDALDLILGSRSAHLIERLEGLGWGFIERPDARQNRVIDFGECWETYWKGRSKDLRSSLRKAQRKLDVFPHRYVEADPGNYQPLLETAIKFSQVRWDPDGNRTIWYEALRDLAAASALRGELSAYAIEAEDRLVAVTIAFRAGDRAYGTIQGYDPAFAVHGLGNLVNAWALERMASTGVRRVEMGDGAKTWKDRFNTGITETVLVRIGASMSGKAFVGWKSWLKPQLAGILAR